MNGLALVVALSLAQPVDVPLSVDAGTPIVTTDVVLTEAQAIAAAKRIKACEAERDVFRASPPPPPWTTVLVVGIVSLLVGGAIGAGVVIGAQSPR